MSRLRGRRSESGAIEQGQSLSEKRNMTVASAGQGLGALERSYIVTLVESWKAHSLGFSYELEVLTLPLAAFPPLRDLLTTSEQLAADALEGITGLRIQETYAPNAFEELLIQLISNIPSNLVGGGAPQQAGVIVSGFVRRIVAQPFVPVEGSPLTGETLTSLANKSSLIGFASALEGYGVLHHDAIVILLTPVCVLLIGASVGGGEGLRERIRDFVAKGKEWRK